MAAPRWKELARRVALRGFEQAGNEVAVTGKRFPLFVDIPVHAVREIPIVHVFGLGTLPVQIIARQIGQRRFGEQPGRRLVEAIGRDDVAGEWRAHAARTD